MKLLHDKLRGKLGHVVQIHVCRDNSINEKARDDFVAIELTGAKFHVSEYYTSC